MQNIKEIRVTIDTAWLSEITELIREVKRSPSTEKVTELAMLVEAHTDRKIPVEELFAMREAVAAKLRQSGALLR